jgi:hypothetical protein
MPSLFIVVKAGMLCIARPHLGPSVKQPPVNRAQYGQMHPPTGKIDGTTVRKDAQDVSSSHIPPRTLVEIMPPGGDGRQQLPPK